MNDAHLKYEDQPTLILLINEHSAPLGELKPKMIVRRETKCYIEISTHMGLSSCCANGELEVNVEGERKWMGKSVGAS